MIVEITTDIIPLSFSITCDVPGLIDVVQPEPFRVSVSVMRDGVDGAPGLSAFQLWLLDNPDGTLSEFWESLKGERATNNDLAAVIAENNKTGDNIDFEGFRAKNASNGVDLQDYVTVRQYNALKEEMVAYTDTKSADAVQWAGFWDASTNTYPTTAGIRRGNEYEISVEGFIGMVFFEVGDIIRARINTPGQIAANWSVAQGNVQQAMENRQGSLRIATAETVGDKNTVNNADAVPAKKLWQNFVPAFLMNSWIWSARQIFSSAPRLSTVSPRQFLKVDINKDIVGVDKIPAADVEISSERVFLSAYEKNLLPKRKSYSLVLSPYTLPSALYQKAFINNGVFEADANKWYSFKVCIYGTGLISTNMRANFGFIGTALAGGFYVLGQSRSVKSMGANSPTQAIIINSTGAETALLSANTGTIVDIMVEGRFKTDGAGTITPGIGFNISSTVTIEPGSFWEVAEISAGNVGYSDMV